MTLPVDSPSYSPIQPEECRRGSIMAPGARTAGASPSCAFGHMARAVNSRRSAFSLVLYLMSATVTATSRKVGWCKRHTPSFRGIAQR